MYKRAESRKYTYARFALQLSGNHLSQLLQKLIKKIKRETNELGK